MKIQVLQTMGPESGFRFALNWPSVAKIRLRSKFPDMTSSSIFFTLFSFSCQVFSYWSKCHVNIIGSGVMTISFCKGLTRNRENGNAPVRVLPNIRRLGGVSNTRFRTNVSNKMLLNAVKCQVYNFYRF